MANPIFNSVGTYINENTEPIYGKIVLDIPHLNRFSLQGNAKGGEVALNILTANPVLGDGTTCNVESGDVTFTQRKMKVANYATNTEYCEYAMLPYWAGLKVKLGTADEIALAEAFANAEVTKINKMLERNIWQGKVASDKMDGIATIATADGSEVTLTADNIYGKVNEVRLAAQGAGVDNVVVAMGADKYFAFVDALVARNLFHYKSDATEEMVTLFPGTNVEVWGVAGLNGSNVAVAFNPYNIHYGFDEEAGVSNVKWVVDEVNDTAHLKTRFNAGIQIAFPEEVFYASI